MAVGGKRKRQAAAARSEVDRFAHKSGVLLQREAKKARVFLVRKGVQQLKQTRAQLEQRRSADSSKSGGDGGAKLSATVQRLEREHEALKALDLRAVAQRAMVNTGLQKRLQQQQRGSESDASGSDDDDDDMRGGGDGSDDDDDGFDSEEYENARRAGALRGEDDNESEEEDDESEEEEEASEAPSAASPTAAPTPSEKKSTEAAEEDKRTKKRADEQLQTMLVDRILAHKLMKPLLEAIEKWLENEERETEKKLRRQEKKALKHDRNEVLVGGRSAAAPASLFLGSLSGRGGADELADDGYGAATASHMVGAEDDIAEFLGEKKKKNRAGQNARRQKAMRVEEAARRKRERESGIFRPRRDDGASKYGPSERPKKKKPAPEGKGGTKRGSEKPKRAGRERERGAPAPRTSGSAAHRAPAAKAEVAHPSWLAKQALKEKEKASVGAFSGKKITFE